MWWEAIEIKRLIAGGMGLIILAWISTIVYGLITNLFGGK